MIYAITTENMKNSDNLTIKKGVSACELMKKASNALFEQVKILDAYNIAIVCGSGNNGGDGYALANILLENSYNVMVFGKLPKTMESKFYFDKLLQNYPENLKNINEMQDLTGFDLVVDCLLGIGLKGDLSAEYQGYINLINGAKYVLSCDMPSGLNSDNGKVQSCCVKADMTMAIQCFKTGHFLQDAKDYVGNLVCSDIGIDVVGDKISIIDENYAKIAFAPRKQNCHKGDFGSLGIVACSKNMVGAGVLAYQSATALSGECAMKTGLGLCKLFVPNQMIPSFWSRITNSCVYAHEDIKNFNLDAVAFGMGVGENFDLLEQVVDLPCKKVFDADALNMLSQRKDLLCKIKGSVVTPHPKEFSRLTGLSVKEILDNPIEHARNFAKKYNIVVLLKGATSIVTDGYKTMLNTSGCSALAKGGSGGGR